MAKAPDMKIVWSFLFFIKRLNFKKIRLRFVSEFFDLIEIFLLLTH